MSKLAVIGTGYVGLTTGAGFASLGHEVVCMDTDESKIHGLERGEMPFVEPDLPERVMAGVDSGLLKFTSSLEDSVHGVEAIFLALPTPQGERGAADLSYMFGVASELGSIINRDVVVVDKSTVVPGTAYEMRRRITEAGAQPSHITMVSNPELLREGSAVRDFDYPQVIIVGTEEGAGLELMREIYHPLTLRNPDVLRGTGLLEAELCKYALNAYLATRASFINEIAAVCDLLGADVEQVRRIMIRDDRVGEKYFFPGGGWGGSCLPKDTRALVHLAKTFGLDMRLVQAAIEVNEEQKVRAGNKILNYYGGDIKGLSFAVWGLAFKRDTDDVRESTAIEVVKALLDNGANVIAFDPEAMSKAKALFDRWYPEGHPNLSFSEDQYAALAGVDGLVVATDWSVFKGLNYERVQSEVRGPVFDLRNLYDPQSMRRHGLNHISIGRPPVLED